MRLGIVEESRNLWSDDWVQWIERAEEYYVFGLYVGVGELQLVMRMVLVEHVVGIVVVVEESQ